MSDLTHMLSLTALVESEEDRRAVFAKLGIVADGLEREVASVSLSCHRFGEEIEGEEYIDEKTVLKVYDALVRVGLGVGESRLAIDAILDAGILFREKR